MTATPQAPEPELWTVHAGGFQATVDAFAVQEHSRANPHYPVPQHLWFLSMVGSQTALKAIGAALLNSPAQAVHLTPGAAGLVLDERRITCQPDAQSGAWTTKLVRLGNQMGWHAMVYPKLAEYLDDRPDFLLLAQPGENPEPRHYQFLDRRLPLPLHHSWADWLWNRGLIAEEIIPLHCRGLQAWRCQPEEAQLAAELSQAVAAGRLPRPGPGAANRNGPTHRAGA